METNRLQSIVNKRNRLIDTVSTNMQFRSHLLIATLLDNKVGELSSFITRTIVANNPYNEMYLEHALAHIVMLIAVMCNTFGLQLTEIMDKAADMALKDYGKDNPDA